jgi:Flp pilus assembly secretin CpaC
MKIPFTGNTGNSAAVPDFAGIITAMTDSLNALAVPLSGDDRTAIGGRVVDTSMNAIDNLSTAGTQNMTWYDAPMEQPFFHVRSIDSKVSITPGATVVMGGLITESRKAMDDKVPFLGDLPFIGRLFRSHAEQTIKRNLLIFVTGRLITPSGRELSLNKEEADDAAEIKAAPTAE